MYIGATVARTTTIRTFHFTMILVNKQMEIYTLIQFKRKCNIKK